MRSTDFPRRPRVWFPLATIVAWLASSWAAAGLPSRLAVKAPHAPGDERAVSWSFPFDGWTYDVQSQESLGAPWTAVPAGSGLSVSSWTESRPAGNARWYRVVANPPPGNRGRLVSATKSTSYGAALLNVLFSLQGIPLVAQHDVDVYKVVYETIDPYGAPAIVSAEVAVPATKGKTWPLMEYAHGTAMKRTDVPSVPGDNEGLLGVAMASGGYVSVLPDYLGLGDSKQSHPYHHAASEATCMVDALRAARAMASGNGTALNGQLFLCGYSQGGHVAMATLRELEQRHAGEFTVTACAPMAGAYDLSGVELDDALSDRQPPTPYYFPYLLKMLVDLYRIAPSLGDVLQEPYATKVPPLFDGLHAGSEVDAVMPKVPKLALKPAYLAAIVADPDHPLRVALRDNDLTGFRPGAPMRMFHCSGDLDVLPANSEVALARFKALGATDVTLADPSPGADHGGCVQPALLAAKAWFDTLKH